ncbi:MAG: leucyl aminopeptidase family protein [Bacteroidales bacterium]|nr:leucyl aminopeptidase family protein [Bacteroidales bacterium]
MMSSIVLKKIEKVDFKNNIVILAQNTGDLKPVGLSKNEFDFVKKKFSDDVKFIIVNRLDKNIWIFFFNNCEEEQYIRNETYRRAGNNLLEELSKNQISKVQIADLQKDKSVVSFFIEGLALGAYVFDKYKKANYKLQGIELFSKNLVKAELQKLFNVVETVFMCRDLVNEPVSYLTTSKFKEIIFTTAKESKLRVDIFDESKLASLKMGGILAVNKGSEEPPFFAVVEWKPAEAVNKKPYILVGKGVTFDTGGYSLKTNESMQSMKCDMSGAAVTIALLSLLSKNNIPVHVIGLIPATDNRVNEKAQVPGDIITMHNGTTVEVLNTDAEGRLILADALSYAKRYKPELVIDLATLTGAAHAALGKYGIFAAGKNHEHEMDSIKQCGLNVYERIVEFPLWEEYEDTIKSKVADIKNTGQKHAGAISAAKFLEHFTDYPWIHFDIAGPAFFDSPWNYHTAGGTGFGIRLLYDFFTGKTI